MQRYDSYKDSGIQWLGEIPSHWEMQRTKYIWRETDTRSENGSEQLLSVSQYDGVRESKSDSRSESLKGYKLVKQSELVINIMLAWLGGLGVSKYEGLVSPAYCVYKLISKQNPYFLHYLYRTPMYLSEFARRSSGIVPSRWRMYSDDFGEVLTLLPPLPEQQAITSYLDTATAKIDEAIAQQQKMIDLLNERKQIIINNAVTKGLNPNAKMKPSGIGTNRIKLLYAVDNISDVDHYMPNDVINGIPYIMTGDLKEATSMINFSGCKHISKQDYERLSKKHKIKKGDVILARYATIGTACYVDTDIEMIVSYSCVTISPNKQIMEGKYLYYYLKSKHFKDDIYPYINSNTQGNVGLDSLKRVYVSVPSLIEQKEIVLRLEDDLRKLSNTILNTTKQITLLQERKQIIINDVVTGKVKVTL
ncbi:MAG: restriction endonuclease subunit S [Bacteroidales bacterium]|nr:restriction endonuclease subunit S [Bacteroidales bacterium]